jgi:hypothetical protein
MPATLRLWCVAVLCAGGALAQSVDIYTTPSTDGTNFYATGVMQVSMANTAFCQSHYAECASATHTYSQTVTATSPSGRTASCTFQSKYPPTLPWISSVRPASPSTERAALGHPTTTSRETVRWPAYSWIPTPPSPTH